MTQSVFPRLPPRLQEAIVSRLGWSALRPVQDLAGAAILDGHNALILAPTAGGKTEAAIFPSLAGLLRRPPQGVGLMYLAPIKALLNNQEERLGTYTEMVGLRRFVWHGDVAESAKRAFVKEPAELLMTTPESLEVMLLSQRIPVETLFRELRAVIVDEVHAFCGTDRGAHLLSLIERIAPLCGSDLQRIGLSATIGNPEQILSWLQGSSARPSTVVRPPKAPAKRALHVSLHPSAPALAQAAAERALGHKSLFFCQSRSLTELVAQRMSGLHTEVFVHHSSVSTEERHAAEERFHRGQNVCIVCTSTLELGIDVGDLDQVFQANAPSSVSSFLQRMGRTGRRAGQTANTTFFCETADAVLQAISIIELAREKWVESVPQKTRCWPVMVHQLLALTLQFGAISAERCWSQLHRVPDFSGIREAEFLALVAHLKAQDFLFESGGLLSMGQKAERVFGRKNFLELYAVFTSPQLYRVETAGGQTVGSLEQGFVDRLVEEMSSFLLGGRAWKVDKISHSDRVLHVSAAPRGQKPSWGGFVPQLLSFPLCQRMRRVLAEETVYPYLDDASQRALADRRADLGPLLARGGLAIQLDDTAARLWTFAGGCINHTLKYALEWTTGWRVIADNLQLRIEGDGVQHQRVEAALGTIAALGFWDDSGTQRALLARLPEYRLSKFQQALPEAMALEMVGEYLLDIEGARGWLTAAAARSI